MKVLITGKGGQLSWELESITPDGVELFTFGQNQLDITDSAAVLAAITEIKPAVVINAAAYTAVDNAETDTKTAYAVNELGAKYLAEACVAVGARLLHVSTDFIFDGFSSTPYSTNAEPNPLNVYGASKLAGERAVQAIIPDNSVIVRTAWVYSAFGNNFVKTMLTLMAIKPELGIVYDQVGSPTWANGLATWLWAVCEYRDVKGVYHWTDAGVASWYDFAVAIQELAIEKGLLKKAIPIRPIPASSYPTPATRPSCSVLNKFSAEHAVGLETIHWRQQLSAMMDEIPRQES